MLALPLKNAITGCSDVVKALCSGTTARAVASGRAIAKFLGTSSPTTIEKPLTSTTASRTDSAPLTAVLTQPSNRSPSRAATAGCVV